MHVGPVVSDVNISIEVVRFAGDVTSGIEVLSCAGNVKIVRIAGEVDRGIEVVRCAGDVEVVRFTGNVNRSIEVSEQVVIRAHQLHLGRKIR